MIKLKPSLKSSRELSSAAILPILDIRVDGVINAISRTPVGIEGSDLFNVDLVISNTRSPGHFDYSDGARVWRSTNIDAEHLHLHLPDSDFELIKNSIGKKITLSASSIVYMYEHHDHYRVLCSRDPVFVINARRKDFPIDEIVEDATSPTNTKACHYITDLDFEIHQSWLSKLFGTRQNKPRFHAHAAAAFGGQIAKNSMKKAREAGLESYKNSDAGKNKAARDAVDHQDRMAKARAEQKGK